MSPRQLVTLSFINVLIWTFGFYVGHTGGPWLDVAFYAGGVVVGLPISLALIRWRERHEARRAFERSPDAARWTPPSDTPHM